jgi:hypothetical protein
MFFADKCFLEYFQSTVGSADITPTERAPLHCFVSVVTGICLYNMEVNGSVFLSTSTSFSTIIKFPLNFKFEKLS